MAMAVSLIRQKAWLRVHDVAALITFLVTVIAIAFTWRGVFSWLSSLPSPFLHHR